MKKNNFFWVIGGGQMQIPLIYELKKINLKVIVSDYDNNCICKSKADIFLNIDIFDVNSHILESNKIISNGISIVGVLAAGIDAPITMCKLSEHLGLRTTSSKIAEIVHNKNLFRKKIKDLGYPVPNYIEIKKIDLVNIKNIVKKLSLPFIVKNSDSSGSRGTKIFYDYNYDDIVMILKEAIRVSKSGIALIEECWEGPEQTVETLFDIDGNFHPCFITDRIFDKSSGYAIEKGLISPSRLPKKIQNEMFKLAKNVSLDLGINFGPAKFDMILTKNGPRIIEMTVRLSGGFDCQYLVPAASGKNILKAAILTTLGKKISKDLLIDRLNKVAISESIWPKRGIIESIKGLNQVKLNHNLEFIFFRNKVGDRVTDYIDCTKRVCFIIVSNNTLNEAKLSMKEIKSKIKINIK